jgi:hypothetical protein
MNPFHPLTLAIRLFIGSMLLGCASLPQDEHGEKHSFLFGSMLSDGLGKTISTSDADVDSIYRLLKRIKIFPYYGGAIPPSFRYYVLEQRHDGGEAFGMIGFDKSFNPLNVSGSKQDIKALVQLIRKEFQKLERRP